MTATVVRARTSRWYRNVQLSLGLGATAGAGLLLVGDVDPVDQMVSQSIRTVPGAVLLALAACGLAAAGAWLLAGARRVLSPAWPLTVLLSVWCVSLLAVVVFPTNLPGTEPGVAAGLHRLGAALMAALPPLFALLIAKRAGRGADPARVRWLRAAGWSAFAACVAFAAVNGPAMLLGQGLLPFAGLAERVLLALVLVVVGLCAWVLEGEERS
ncbi:MULTISPECIES: DUF998 domain-containing protein [unclassified Micromonospora]|uniref:DUF998 domain-containing protein n=1 Tax=unclassified Micromonospora TaxID=2617518 RepID=UPI0022B6A1AF|nr:MULTISPECIES: DUF998 domain-containing protein [unclassified Micromonospora]MCZ7421968.1 DUF998 domain-containing protein [Verrucosispora sp. WMMA2121]WBB93298.1 DUF998 domain-containing protein [Verrucosispora sp. WMMC514]